MFQNAFVYSHIHTSWQQYKYWKHSYFNW